VKLAAEAVLEGLGTAVQGSVTYWFC